MEHTQKEFLVKCQVGRIQAWGRLTRLLAGTVNPQVNYTLSKTLPQSEAVGSRCSNTKHQKGTNKMTKMTVVSISSRRKRRKGMFPLRFLHHRKKGTGREATNGITMFQLSSTELLELCNKIQPCASSCFHYRGRIAGRLKKKKKRLEPECLKCILACA